MVSRWVWDVLIPSDPRAAFVVGRNSPHSAFAEAALLRICGTIKGGNVAPVQDLVGLVADDDLEGQEIVVAAMAQLLTLAQVRRTVGMHAGDNVISFLPRWEAVLGYCKP